VHSSLVRAQVKSAWKDLKSGNYVVDNRRTKTNRRKMIREKYSPHDFDFALVYVEQLKLFYVFPVNEFIKYGSEIHLVESEKRQRKPKSAEYRDAWYLILERASYEETHVKSSVKLGEVCGEIIPSQAS